MIMGSKYVHKCKTCNISHHHPIGFSPSDRMAFLLAHSNRIGCGLHPIGWTLSENYSFVFLCCFTLHALSFFVAWLYPLELDISLINMCRKLVFIKSFCPCIVSFFSWNSPNVYDHFISSYFNHFYLLLAIFACINTFPQLSNKYIQIWPISLWKTNNNATKNMLTLSVIKSPTLELCSPSSKS